VRNVSFIALTLLAPTLPGCVLSVLPLSEDLSGEPWDRAVHGSVDRLEQTYSFTAHKELDLGAIREDLHAQAERAMASDDERAWDRVVGSLVLALPDGHVYVEHDEPSRELCAEAAGSAGVRLSQVEDGGLVVVDVEPRAVEAGVRVADRVVAIDGQDPVLAIEQAPLHCSPIGLATVHKRRRVAVRLLTRGPLGDVLTLELQREGVAHVAELPLEADGDDVRAHLGLEPPEQLIAWEILDDDIGYIQLGWEETALSEARFRRALSDLHRRGARALIVDLRDNDGGTDMAAANIVGLFTDRTWFYETITMYDRISGGQVPISEIEVTPQELFWDGPTIVLINDNTVSSGEGMAMMLARFPGVEVMGFEGTAASFGSAGSTLHLPDGWTLHYPAGRSLDASGEIQLDSDASLRGGVLPTLRVPWTVDNRIAHAQDPHGALISLAVEHLQGVR